MGSTEIGISVSSNCKIFTSISTAIYLLIRNCTEICVGFNVINIYTLLYTNFYTMGFSGEISKSLSLVLCKDKVKMDR
jgi:hypothetical protein